MGISLGYFREIKEGDKRENPGETLAYKKLMNG